jgi:hypothetical protein
VALRSASVWVSWRQCVISTIAHCGTLEHCGSVWPQCGDASDLRFRIVGFLDASRDAAQPRMPSTFQVLSKLLRALCIPKMPSSTARVLAFAFKQTMTVGFLQILLLPCQKQGQLVHVAVCQRVVLQESCTGEISLSPSDAQPPQHCAHVNAQCATAAHVSLSRLHRIVSITPSLTALSIIGRVRPLLCCDYVHCMAFVGISAVGWAARAHQCSLRRAEVRTVRTE